MSASGSYVSKAPDRRFILFPKLPAEIRVQIWKEALSIPQKVVFEVVQTPFSSNKAFMQRVSKVNPLLHVCRESREEFLAVYFKKAGDPLNLDERAAEDVWDIWRYFRFGVDICELRNDSRVPWTFLMGALGGESYGLELVMGRKNITAT